MIHIISSKHVRSRRLYFHKILITGLNLSQEHLAIDGKNHVQISIDNRHNDCENIDMISIIVSHMETSKYPIRAFAIPEVPG